MLKTAGLDGDARDFVDALSKALKEKSARLSPTQLVTLAAEAIQKTFTGSSTQDKLAKAMARGLSIREKMAAAEGGTMSAEETARLLRLTKQSILNLYHGGKLLGWKTAKQGAIRFPVWQFADSEKLAGLDEVLSRLNSSGPLDDWAKVGFFLQEHHLLHGKRPLDLLRENKLSPVLKAADAYVE